MRVGLGESGDGVLWDWDWLDLWRYRAGTSTVGKVRWGVGGYIHSCVYDSVFVADANTSPCWYEHSML